jgi:hypothetical protein
MQSVDVAKILPYQSVEVRFLRAAVRFYHLGIGDRKQNGGMYQVDRPVGQFLA